jgi:hypothetical protein
MSATRTHRLLSIVDFHSGPSEASSFFLHVKFFSSRPKTRQYPYQLDARAGQKRFIHLTLPWAQFLSGST